MEISNQTQKTWKTKILIQRIAMGTHLTETKSEKKSLNAKRNGSNFDVLQRSSFKRVGSTGSFDDYGESFWCLYTKKTQNICCCFIARFSSSSFHGPFHIMEICVVISPKIPTCDNVQVTISLRFFDQTKLQTWEPVSMDDNGMLFTVFQNRMHLARDFLGKKNIQKKQGVKETILEKLVLFGNLEEEGAVFFHLSNLEVYNNK